MADLITLQQYKDHQGLTGQAQDLRINTLIDSVSQLVKNYCGTDIVDHYSSAKTEYFDVLDARTTRVMLDEGPIRAVTSVAERESQADSYVTLIKENSNSSGKYEYIVDDLTDSIVRTNENVDKAFPKGRKAVKVVYTAGYSTTPLDLRLAVVDLVKYYLKDEAKERMQIAGATVENASSSSLAGNTGFPDHIKRVLDMYKVYT